jgi:hypothetical protein
MIAPATRHNPPHFHALYGNDEAVIDIKTLDYLDGNLPKRARNLVNEWPLEHRDELLSNWEKGRKPEELQPIEPLN